MKGNIRFECGNGGSLVGVVLYRVFGWAAWAYGSNSVLFSSLLS